MRSATSYIPEQHGTDTAASKADGARIDGTRCGAALSYPKPGRADWIGVPADGARDVPDSLSPRLTSTIPITSCRGQMGALWGGRFNCHPGVRRHCRIAQSLPGANKAQSKPGVGNINPALYQLAQTVPQCFSRYYSRGQYCSVRQGTPGCHHWTFGYTAGPGYDLATGLASVDAYNLVTQWNSNQPIRPLPPQWCSPVHPPP